MSKIIKEEKNEVKNYLLGQLQEEGRTVVFLAAQGSNYPVRVGDTVVDTYRVEQITERAVTLRYLPLDLQQTLAIGEPR